MKITIGHIESIVKTLDDTKTLLEAVGYELVKMLEYLKTLDAKKRGDVRVEVRGRVPAGPVSGRRDRGVRAMGPDEKPPLYEGHSGKVVSIVRKAKKANNGARD